jgi:hypothetical protein
MGMKNESGLSNNGIKDVSVSNVPNIGKRDKLKKVSTTPEGTTTETYVNDYLWEAESLWEEKLSQWLAIKSDFVHEVFLTYVASKLWSSLAFSLFPLAPVISSAMVTAFVLFCLVCAFLLWRNPNLLAASALRLFIITIGVL